MVNQLTITARHCHCTKGVNAALRHQKAKHDTLESYLELKKGCVLSPLLFIIAIDYTLRNTTTDGIELSSGVTHWGEPTTGTYAT